MKTMSSIRSAIEAVEGARLDWATNDKVYAALGIALRSLRTTEKKAEKEVKRGPTMAEREKAYRDGLEAVRSKPHYAPSNPHDAYKELDMYESWEDGAISAGINDIYYNGVLKR